MPTTRHVRVQGCSPCSLGRRGGRGSSPDVGVVLLGAVHGVQDAAHDEHLTYQVVVEADVPHVLGLQVGTEGVHLQPQRMAVPVPTARCG